MDMDIILEFLSWPHGTIQAWIRGIDRTQAVLSALVWEHKGSMPKIVAALSRYYNRITSSLHVFALCSADVYSAPPQVGWYRGTRLATR